MTRTVTLMIIRTAFEHSLSYDSAKEARRYRRGDIVDVMLTPPNATKVGNDWFWNNPIPVFRFCLIHMRDVPEDRWQNMRKRFVEPLVEGNIGFSDQTTDDGALTVRRRRWRWQIPQMAVPKRNLLLNDGEVTFAWTAARDLIRRKVYTVMDDSSQDDETNAVQDSDLPA